MQRVVTVYIICLLVTSFVSIEYVQNFKTGNSYVYFKDEYAFGPLIGSSMNNTGAVDWIMLGNWRSSLTNNAEISANQSNIDTIDDELTHNFNAAIEMIRPDGTSRHTHALTDFVISNTVASTKSNSTMFNGTSTISLREGPAIDIPTVIQKSNNNNVFVIMIDPKGVDYHFGDSSLMYGVNLNTNLSSSTFNSSKLDIQ